MGSQLPTNGKVGTFAHNFKIMNYVRSYSNFTELDNF